MSITRAYTACLIEILWFSCHSMCLCAAWWLVNVLHQAIKDPAPNSTQFSMLSGTLHTTPSTSLTPPLSHHHSTHVHVCMSNHFRILSKLSAFLAPAREHWGPPKSLNTLVSLVGGGLWDSLGKLHIRRRCMSLLYPSIL